MQSTITSLEDVKSRLIRNDLTYIAWLTRHRGLNDGRGFSLDYVNRVLSPNDKRWNDDIIRLALEVIAWRGLIEQGDSALQAEVDRMWAAMEKPKRIYNKTN